MKRKSPDLALAISLTTYLWLFFVFILFLNDYNYINGNFGTIVIAFSAIVWVVDGYGQFYNGKYRKGLEFLAWSGLRASAPNHEGLKGALAQ